MKLNGGLGPHAEVYHWYWPNPSECAVLDMCSYFKLYNTQMVTIILIGIIQAMAGFCFFFSSVEVKTYDKRN